MKTHEVVNQSYSLDGYNVVDGDQPLLEGLKREGGAWILPKLTELGALAGGEAMAWGRLANDNPPVLRTHDRYGNRIDEVEYHPAYHQLMKASVGFGVHALPWQQEKKSGAFVARAACGYTMSQAENGHGCPITMTFAVVPAMKVQPDVAAQWVPKLTAASYDSRFIPVAGKTGAIAGMAMTEKQGGSDVRANTSRAVAAGSKTGPGAEYLLTGHKWFCSAPMSDVFLTLANTDKGLTCFALPRWTPDGKRNNIFIQRLKDKLGNNSNASSEIEFENAWAQMVGEDGRGVRTIIEMVQHTRLDCVMGSTSTMRQSVAQAIHHTSNRSAFGKRLVEQPLMKNVLADLCVEVEAATMLMFRLARAYDEAQTDKAAALFARLATPVSKYWVTKRCASVVGEALEAHGGPGYVEEGPMARLYRDAPLNSIWEGSGNVICLDVLRAMVKEPDATQAFIGELVAAKGADRHYDAYVDRLLNQLSDPANAEVRARQVVEQLAKALQGSLMVKHGHPAVSAAFCKSRLAGEHGDQFGTLPPSSDFDAIIERSRPVPPKRA
ncbi:MAG: acyl-CoA dehydrogenase family protein [Myxococcaceae bacterium]